jgi:hypothetical protein
MMEYKQLREIDVSKYTEKKNGLTYLSWAWAVDQLLLSDPKAYWFYSEPKHWGETVMVFCTVVSNDVARTAQLPVMDYRNKAIPNPDAFAVNTAMQRCLAKAIALHGIGLYIYNGEDVPPELGIDVKQESAPKPVAKPVGVTPPPKPPAPKPPVVKAEAPKGWTLSAEHQEFGSPDWVKAIIGGAEAALALASTVDDVANIFKNNRVSFDKIEEVDKKAFSDLMSSFSTTKKSLTKE